MERISHQFAYTPHLFAVVGAALLVFAGCGGSGDPDASSGAGTASGDAAVQAPRGDDKMFNESIEDQECTILKTEDVASATGVPVEEIEQQAISGCLYSWDAGASWPDGSIMLMSVSVHESIDRAKSYYARFTKDTTAEETAASKEAFKDEVAKKREAGELTTSGKAIAGALADAMPEEDISYRRWTDIGSEASTDGNGSVRVRYGNATAWFVGKTAGEDRLDDEIARQIALRIVANLDDLG